jgi:hypothetical protein
MLPSILVSSQFQRTGQQTIQHLNSRVKDALFLYMKDSQRVCATGVDR